MPLEEAVQKLEQIKMDMDIQEVELILWMDELKPKLEAIPENEWSNELCREADEFDRKLNNFKVRQANFFEQCKILRESIRR